MKTFDEVLEALRDVAAADIYFDPGTEEEGETLLHYQRRLNEAINWLSDWAVRDALTDYDEEGD